MDPIGAVGAVADKPAAVEAGAVDQAQPSQDFVQMLPPGADKPSLSLSGQIWSGLDNLSVKMREITESAQAQVPIQSVEASDLVGVMRESQMFQAQLLEMQMKINGSQGIFSVALGMLQSTQHGVQTLFQDK